MNTLCLMFIIITMVCEQVAECKLMKRNPALKKMSNHLKPSKSSKGIVDAFKDLPAEDIDFIKQLDNQFNKFGGKVRIKVQRENRTNGKNIKRTIDGNLGYGYQSPNDQQSGYSFSKPRFEVYPYSQHDIPPSRDYHQSEHNLHYLRHYPQALVESDPSYYQKQAEHTSVEIQQSHSYEIKQTDDGYKTVYNGDDSTKHTDQSTYNPESSISGDTVPVIVLRLPGPTKYASHLQALLQQYIELRAAQYLQLLQENDAKQKIYDHTQYRGQDDTSGPINSFVHPQAYISAPMLIQPVPALHFTPSLPDPYQQSHEPHFETGDRHMIASPSPTSYYMQPNAEPNLGVINPVSYEYHNVHAHLHSQGLCEEIVYGSPHDESVSEHNQALRDENFPSDKYTQVIFKSTTAAPFYQTADQNTEIEHEQPQQPQHPQHANPAIQNYQTPVGYHNSEQYYNSPEPNYDQQSNDELISGENAGYVSGTNLKHSNEEVIPITQRPAVLPHNYHAQLAQLANYDDTAGYEYQQPSYDENGFKRSSNRKRQSNRSRDDHNKKIKSVAHRMKSRMANSNEAERNQT